MCVCVCVRAFECLKDISIKQPCSAVRPSFQTVLWVYGSFSGAGHCKSSTIHDSELIPPGAEAAEGPGALNPLQIQFLFHTQFFVSFGSNFKFPLRNPRSLHTGSAPEPNALKQSTKTRAPTTCHTQGQFLQLPCGYLWADGFSPQLRIIGGTKPNQLCPQTSQGGIVSVRGQRSSVSPPPEIFRMISISITQMTMGIEALSSQNNSCSVKQESGSP